MINEYTAIWIIASFIRDPNFINTFFDIKITHFSVFLLDCIHCQKLTKYRPLINMM